MKHDTSAGQDAATGAHTRDLIMERLDEIPAAAVLGIADSTYSMYDPIGPLLLMEQCSDGRVRHHSVVNEEALSALVEQILNRDPTTFVRVFHLQELTINRYEEYRVELQ